MAHSEAVVGTAPGATRIDIVECAKTYPDGTEALAATTLSIAAGEVLALLGPSGCGKTTLLRVVAGLVTPDAGGSILFNGEDVTQRPIETRAVGMVFQHYALFPQMTVEANIAYGLRIRHTPQDALRARVAELITLVHLQGLEKRKPAELSGGQRQRVALARAVAAQPRVLLLDEPLTALDAKLKDALRDELAELLRRLQITAIYVTHDQQEAMAVADRLAVMRQGQIVQVGAPEALYRSPAHPFVAQFLGRVNRLTRSPAAALANQFTLNGRTYPCAASLTGQTELLLRPEDIAVFASTHPASSTVVRRVFLGERIQLTVDTPDHGRLMCEGTKEIPFHVGDRVDLIIDPAVLMRALEA